MTALEPDATVEAGADPAVEEATRQLAQKYRTDPIKVGREGFDWVFSGFSALLRQWVSSNGLSCRGFLTKVDLENM